MRFKIASAGAKVRDAYIATPWTHSGLHRLASICGSLVQVAVVVIER